MSKDTFHLATGARERILQRTPLRKYLVPFVIEGAVEVWATDADVAKFLADNKPRAVFEDERNSTLTVYDAEPAEQTQ